MRLKGIKTNFNGEEMRAWSDVDRLESMMDQTSAVKQRHSALVMAVGNKENAKHISSDIDLHDKTSHRDSQYWPIIEMN